jgi:hypothetical protein
MIHKRTRCYIDCEIYNYHYEDNCCVFDNQININQKKYRVAYPNTECEGIFVKNIGRRRLFTFRDAKTLAQALGYHESNNDVDASI